MGRDFEVGMHPRAVRLRKKSGKQKKERSCTRTRNTETLSFRYIFCKGSPYYSSLLLCFSRYLEIACSFSGENEHWVVQESQGVVLTADWSSVNKAGDGT